MNTYAMNDEEKASIGAPPCPSCGRPADVSEHYWFMFDIQAVRCPHCELYGIKDFDEPWLPKTASSDAYMKMAERASKAKRGQT